MDASDIGAIGALLTAWAGGIWIVVEAVSKQVKALPYGHHILPWLPIIIGALSALVYLPHVGDIWLSSMPWPHQLLTGGAAGAFACKLHEEKNRLTKEAADGRDT